MIPFEEVYGENPPSDISYMFILLKVQMIDQNLTVRDSILRTLKENLVMDLNRMKQQEIKFTQNINVLKGTRHFLDYNLLKILHSRLTIVIK
jgi:hypothetical protein